MAFRTSSPPPHLHSAILLHRWPSKTWRGWHGAQGRTQGGTGRHRDLHPGGTGRCPMFGRLWRTMQAAKGGKTRTCWVGGSHELRRSHHRRMIRLNGRETKPDRWGLSSSMEIEENGYLCVCVASIMFKCVPSPSLSLSICSVEQTLLVLSRQRRPGTGKSEKTPLVAGPTNKIQNPIWERTFSANSG